MVCFRFFVLFVIYLYHVFFCSSAMHFDQPGGCVKCSIQIKFVQLDTGLLVGRFNFACSTIQHINTDNRLLNVHMLKFLMVSVRCFIFVSCKSLIL